MSLSIDELIQKPRVFFKTQVYLVYLNAGNDSLCILIRPLSFGLSIEKCSFCCLNCLIRTFLLYGSVKNQFVEPADKRTYIG